MRRLMVPVVLLVLLSPIASAAQYGSDCIDAVACRIEGASILVEHTGAWYNCCPEMAWTMQTLGRTLRIEETEIEGLCDCMCCFDYGVSVAGLEAGEWTVVFAWNDSNASPAGPREATFTVIVPEGGAADAAGLETIILQDCYDPTPTGIYDAVPQWGMIKSLFR